MGQCGVGVNWGLIARVAAVGGSCLALAHCGQSPGQFDPKYGVSASPRVVQFGEPVPKGGGRYSIGKPYMVAGRVYTPEENPNYSAEGLASWYGDDFHGRVTANGEIFDMTSISAAHPTLPIPSYARVTNLSNQRSIIVRVNDRGPYHQGRLIDVSVRAAKLLGFHGNGVTRVRVDYVGRASLAGSDDAKLEATLRQGTPAPGPSEVRVASSRPFLPESGSSGRGAVPIPADRPFELGAGQGGAQLAAARQDVRPNATHTAAVSRQPLPPPTRTASAAPVSAIAAPARTVSPAPAAESLSTNAAQASFASRFAPASGLAVASARAEPVSAFAPSPVSSSAFVSGRGLY